MRGLRTQSEAGSLRWRDVDLMKPSKIFTVGVWIFSHRSLFYFPKFS